MGDEEKALLLDVTVEEFGSPGRLISAETAKTNPCKCLEDNPPRLCFVPGIIGTLTVAQVSEFCLGKPVEKLSDGRRTRIEKFKEAAAVCKSKPPPEGIAGVPRGERLDPWLSCMGRELKSRGIEV